MAREDRRAWARRAPAGGRDRPPSGQSPAPVSPPDPEPGNRCIGTRPSPGDNRRAPPRQRDQRNAVASVAVVVRATVVLERVTRHVELIVERERRGLPAVHAL